MYRFITKYKAVIMNIVIFISLILIYIGFYKDIFLGAATGIILIKLGESIGDLKREKNENALREEVQVINE